jgi:hypothetical protein
MIIEALKEYTDPVNHAYFYPEQFISVSEKEKEQWIKGTMDYFANIAFAQYKQNIQFRKNYRLLNGEFNFSDYTNNAEIQELVSYLNDTPDQDPDVPQHLKHYPIVNPPVNQLKGELINRPHKYKVKAIDDEAVNETIDFRTELIKEHFLKKLQAQLEGQEIDPEQEAQMQQELQDKILDYTSVAEEWGNKTLNALKYHFNFREKSQQSFLDFLVQVKSFTISTLITLA